MPEKFDFYCEEALSGKALVDNLYESEHVLAFHHTRPSYATHIVIIPKKHILDLASFSDDELGILNEIIKVARDLSKNLDKNAVVKLLTNIGVFQEAPHAHFHLVVGEKLR